MKKVPTNNREWRIFFKLPYYKLQYKKSFLWWKYWATYHCSIFLEEVEELYKLKYHLKVGPYE